MIYVGYRDGHYIYFRSEVKPTHTTHGNLYNYVIGPFKTKRGAKFMVDYGRNNPHCQTVDDAERLGKLYDKKARIC